MGPWRVAHSCSCRCHLPPSQDQGSSFGDQPLGVWGLPGPWGPGATWQQAAGRRPAPSGCDGGWAGWPRAVESTSFPQAGGRNELGRPSPGTTHPWGTGPTLGWVLWSAWVHQGGRHERTAKPFPIHTCHTTLHSQWASQPGGRAEGQAFLEQPHGPGRLCSCPCEGKPRLPLASTRGPERAAALPGVTQRVSTARDPSSVCPGVTTLLPTHAAQVSPVSPLCAHQSEGTTNRVQKSQNADTPEDKLLLSLELQPSISKLWPKSLLLKLAGLAPSSLPVSTVPLSKCHVGSRDPASEKPCGADPGSTQLAPFSHPSSLVPAASEGSHCPCPSVLPVQGSARPPGLESMTDLSKKLSLGAPG